MIYSMLSEDSIPSEKLFLSSAFQIYLEDTTNNILRRSKKRKVNIEVVKSSETETASTTGTHIRINYNFYVIQKLKDKYLQFRFLRGFNGHELGHVLFDDFLILHRIKQMWKIGSIYPLSNHLALLSKEQAKIYSEMKEFMEDSTSRQIMLKTYLELDNILSDSYVNYQVLSRVGTYKDDLQFVLDIMRTTLPSYEQLLTVPSDMKKIMQLIHWCSVYNVLPDTREDVLVMDVVRLIPILEKIRTTVYAETRTFYYQIIFCEIWKYIKGCLDNKHEESNNESEQSNGSSSESDVDNQSCENNQFSRRPDLTSTPNYEPRDISECESIPLLLLESNGTPHSNMSLLEELSEMGLAQPLSEKADMSIEECLQSLSEDAANSYIQYNKMTALYQKNADYEKGEAEHEKELRIFDSKIEYEKIHQNLDVMLTRVNTYNRTQKQEYEDTLKTKVNLLSKRLADEVLDLPFNKRPDEYLSGFYSGKRINYPAVMRRELKVFDRMKLPLKKLSITIMVVVDESGSMRKDDRIVHSKFACLVFHNMASLLGIPIGIIGHKADCDEPTTGERLSSSSNKRGKQLDVLLKVYSDFQTDENDKYRIMNMEASGCNRDGYALTFGCERLLMQKEDVKICIMISDGLPNAEKNHYNGKIAEKDLKNVCEKYRKKGITIIVAAIGEDKERIKNIYEDGFLDIKSPKDLPKVFTNILKEAYGI